MARTYKRDAKGRFAGGGGTKDPRGPAKVGRAGPRGGKVGSRAEQRQAAKAQSARSTQFRGKAAQGRSARAAYKAAAGAARKAQKQGQPAKTARSTIKRTGGVLAPHRGARSNIRPLGGRNQGGLNTDRQIKAAWRQLRRNQVNDRRWMARTQARALADRLKGGVDAEIAGITLRNLGTRLGRQQIQRRAKRAALKASRGSKPAARALELYDQQLGAMGPGKPSRKAKSNIVAGPRNPNQPPKKSKRKRKK